MPHTFSTAHREARLEEHIVTFLAEHGWVVGDPTCYDRKRALYSEDVIAWLKTTQPEAWEKLERSNGVGVEERVLDRLARALESSEHGIISVLRHGFDVAGAGRLRMSAPRPEDKRNEVAQERYEANILRVVPQVRYSLDNENAIDLVFFINGLPVATVELKTDFTQGVEDAIWQYKRDRKPKSAKGRVEPLLTQKRGAVVHFAMSDSQIFMTTKLAGEDTFFLPFNKGNDGGAGNAPNPNGYPVSYFWEEVLQRDNWLRIFQQFVFVEVEQKEDAQGKAYTSETLIFPRYHQWDAVTKMVSAVREEGPGKPYLVAHSAGSGKTKTITWLAHELIRIRDDAGRAYFDSVILVTDRRVLDQQLQNAILQLDNQRGVVATITGSDGSKSSELAKAMLSSTPIIVVTLQTFPHAMGLILEEASLKDKRFAIVIDEAHSSTGGSTAADLRFILTGEREDDWDKLSTSEKLAARQTSRRPPPNASYFAFTATPKHSTLTLFGRGENNPQAPLSDANKPVEFHAYTMQQAIEEGFILDVLQNYTTYKAAFDLSEKLEKDAKVDARQARRSLARWTSLHPTNVAQKVEFIVQHFQRTVSHLLAGQAKAMIVTSSRAAAVKYKLYFDEYVTREGIEGLAALVAFSGDVLGKDVSDSERQYPADQKFNETNMNPGLHGRELPAAFDTPESRIMIVANKFQTGFDQKKLVAMYLDKKVSGVEAVQTLSRLNRTSPGKTTTYVVDFVNDTETILTSFKQFYKHARIKAVQNPDVVYDEKALLDQANILSEEEITQFAETIVQRDVKHEKLYALTQPATDRFNAKYRALTEQLVDLEKQLELAQESGNEVAAQQLEVRRVRAAEERDALNLFRDGLAKFVRTYQFIAQIIDLNDPSLEAYAEFVRLLRNRLDSVPLAQVDLSGLKLVRYAIKEGDVLSGVGGKPGGGEEQGPLLKPKGAGGQREPRDREKERLSEIIRRMNEAFPSGVATSGGIFLLIQVSETLRGNERVMAQVNNNKREDALKGDLPREAMKAVSGAMHSHRENALELLKPDDGRRGILYEVLYDLIRNPDYARQLLELR